MGRTYIPALRQRLGLTEEVLPDEATDNQIAAALESGGSTRPRVAHDREPARREAQLTHEEREGMLLSAVEAGKFPAIRAPHWRMQLIENPRGAAQVIAMLQPDPARASEPRPGTPEHAQAVAAGRSRPQGQEASADAYPAHWLGPDEQVMAQMVNPPTEEATQPNVLASSAEENTSGYTSIPDEDGPYPSSWIGGTPELVEGPIGFEDPSMRGLSAKGLATDEKNRERRRTKAQA